MMQMRFIQPLEPRRLFSATAATLSSDLSDALAEIKSVRGILNLE